MLHSKRAGLRVAVGISGVSGLPIRPIDSPLDRATDPDSRARTHLANERTFLAWLRTGLSLVAVGLAAAGFFPGNLIPGFPYVTVLSVLFVLSGTLIILYGAVRYTRSSRHIDMGSYDPALTAIVITAAIVGLLGILAIPLVILLR